MSRVNYQSAFNSPKEKLNILALYGMYGSLWSLYIFIGSPPHGLIRSPHFQLGPLSLSLLGGALGDLRFPQSFGKETRIYMYQGTNVSMYQRTSAPVCTKDINKDVLCRQPPKTIITF